MSTSVGKASSDWRRLYPFESHWMEIESGRLHYLDEGQSDSGGEEAACLLFVHGNPTWSFHWRNLIVALRSKYRCIAVDHLGCGLSDKPQRWLELNDHVANLRALIGE